MYISTVKSLVVADFRKQLTIQQKKGIIYLRLNAVITIKGSYIIQNVTNITVISSWPFHIYHHRFERCANRFIAASTIETLHDNSFGHI